jgi:hypothetical protein
VAVAVGNGEGLGVLVGRAVRVGVGVGVGVGGTAVVGRPVAAMAWGVAASVAAMRSGTWVDDRLAVGTGALVAGCPQPARTHVARMRISRARRAGRFMACSL